MTEVPSSKVCTKCGEDKPLDDFNNRKGSKDGKRADCKKCLRLRNTKYREENRDRVLQQKREHYQKNRETIRDTQAKRYADRASDPDELSKMREYRRQEYLKNREAYLSRAKASQRRNRDHRAEYMRQYVDENRERINQRLLDRYRRLYKKDAAFTCSVAARNFLRRCTEQVLGAPQFRQYRDALGYGPKDLKQRMEVQFKPGMSWSNYGEWHIDHKIPVSWFTAKGETRLHIINALSNLQPMWAGDNRSKGNRWAG